MPSKSGAKSKKMDAMDARGDMSKESSGMDDKSKAKKMPAHKKKSSSK